MKKAETTGLAGSESAEPPNSTQGKRGFAWVSLPSPTPVVIGKCLESIDSVWFAGHPDGQNCEKSP
jgi:hypothetical protein